MAGIFGKTLCIPSVWSKFNVPIGLTGKSTMGSIAASSAPASRLSSVPPDVEWGVALYPLSQVSVYRAVCTFKPLPGFAGVSDCNLYSARHLITLSR